MANQEHVELLKQGREAWNKWRRRLPGETLEVDLSNADLRGFDLEGFDLIGADPRSSEDGGIVDISEADLSGANLRGAALHGAQLYRSNLSRANLRDATIDRTNFYRSIFYEADLSFSRFYRSIFYEADLSKASLRQSDLRRTDLRRASFTNADLARAKFGEADLSDADFSGADLSEANFSKANFAKVNLTEVRLQQTVFAANDLSTVKGLLEIRHIGPSHVEIYSVKLPQDGSALHFLRGVGVPDAYIEVWRATTMLPVQYHSLFISYSSKDETLARRLHADLQSNRVRCWFAPEDLKIGNKFRQRIDEAIHLQDKLLLLLSEHSIASTWVENEVEAAIEKENQQQREVLFPIRLDDTVMQTSLAWAAALRRTRHIGNFTNWTDPQAYQQAFERLLRDLKTKS